MADIPEQIQEPERLYDHPNKRPFEKDEEDTTEEAERAADFLFASEEGECLLGTNDQCQTGDEENLCVSRAGMVSVIGRIELVEHVRCPKPVMRRRRRALHRGA